MSHQTVWPTSGILMLLGFALVGGCTQQAHQDPLATGLPARRLSAKPMAESKPSVTGVDRSHWPKVWLSPKDGTPPHGVLFFQDWSPKQPAVSAQTKDLPGVGLDLEKIKLPAEDFSRVHENATVHQAQLVDALDHATAENWSRTNGQHLLLQPFKVALDLALAPLQPVFEPDESDVDTLMSPLHVIVQAIQSGANTAARPFEGQADR